MARHGGREKGTPNRKTQSLIELCEEHGLHPFVEMILNYKLVDDPIKKFDMAERIAQYVYPKRKAVELTGSEGEPVTIEVVIRDYGSKAKA